MEIRNSTWKPHDHTTEFSIDPITRLEGHGKIDIFLDDQGEVANAYLQIPELRGFEKFCVGRPAEDMPNLTARICGVCAEAHHMAATKALDGVFHADPPPAAKKLRELFYSIFFATDHTTHFYALGGPDFVVGPDAPPAEHRSGCFGSFASFNTPLDPSVERIFDLWWGIRRNARAGNL